MINAEMNDLFSVPVAQCSLDINVKQMADECLEYSLVNPSLSKSNVGGYQSNDISKINSSVFKEFFEQLKKEISRFENHTKCPKTSDSYTWININGKKDYNVAHAHPKGIISGVFYVKVPENSGEIILQHPGLQVLESYWSSYYDEYTKYNSATWSFAPKENKLLLFPSWLLHSVEPNLSDEKRISISFNFNGK
ncbi:2OG-Fe(II) oxygenase family protein [bacterium]|nr:2OG-Fe(II) oxygenase family protein [bacterium]